MTGIIWANMTSLLPFFLQLMKKGQLMQPAVSLCMIQQLRFKGSQRYKLPSEPKEKEKRIRKLNKEPAQKVRSPKEMEEFLKRVPVDDVWLREHFPVQRYGFSDAVLMHRELAAPEMFDNADGLVIVDAELDMSTKKKTKFLHSIDGTVLFPHSFDDGVKNIVVAITKNVEDQEAATLNGAQYSGGLNIIKLIERGELRPDDYTHLVCNMDLMTEITVIKKLLKDNFPSRKKGTLDTNITELVKLFVRGRTFASVHVTDPLSKLRIAFGRLNMADDHLRENLQSFVDAASSLKSSSTSKLITKLTIRCPPSKEAFVLRDDQFVAKVAATKRPQEEAEPTVDDVTEEKSDDAVDDEDETAEVELRKK